MRPTQCVGGLYLTVVDLLAPLPINNNNNARILGCYFHLTKSILRKVNKIGMKSDYESDDNLRIAVRCLSAIAMVPLIEVAEAF